MTRDERVHTMFAMLLFYRNQQHLVADLKEPKVHHSHHRHRRHHRPLNKSEVHSKKASPIFQPRSNKMGFIARKGHRQA